MEYVQKMVVQGQESQTGQDSWAAIKLLEMQLKGQIIKLEQEMKASQYEEVTKLQSEINTFKRMVKEANDTHRCRRKAI